MVLRTADGQTAALDFREKAPLAATPDMYLDARGALTDRSRIGHLAAGVPGSVAGMWAAHRRFGSLRWPELIEPAVNLAFPRIEPKKRMLSAMSPTIVLDAEGRVKLVTGSPGGPTIITTVAQIISNVVDFDMDIAAATSAARVHHQHLPDVLYYERDGLRPAVATGLRDWGHTVQARPGYQGDSQSILLRPDGMPIGVADPRRGGAAVTARDTPQTVQ